MYKDPNHFLINFFLTVFKLSIAHPPITTIDVLIEVATKSRLDDDYFQWSDDESSSRGRDAESLPIIQVII